VGRAIKGMECAVQVLAVLAAHLCRSGVQEAIYALRGV